LEEACESAPISQYSIFCQLPSKAAQFFLLKVNKVLFSYFCFNFKTTYRGSLIIFLQLQAVYNFSATVGHKIWGGGNTGNLN